jgi:hypothetical protein
MSDETAGTVEERERLARLVDQKVSAYEGWALAADTYRAWAEVRDWRAIARILRSESAARDIHERAEGDRACAVALHNASAALNKAIKEAGARGLYVTVATTRDAPIHITGSTESIIRVPQLDVFASRVIHHD